jgi:hypothetical protein
MLARPLNSSLCGKMKTKPKFPLWYYGGPYVRVSDPLRDLPQRKMPVLDSEIEFTEKEGIFSGERLIAPFRDNNSTSEIIGSIGYALMYDKYWDDDEKWVFPTIQGLLSQISDRISDKIRRSRNNDKLAIFESALSNIKKAKVCFSESKIEEAYECLWKADKKISSVNRKKDKKLRT